MNRYASRKPGRTVALTAVAAVGMIQAGVRPDVAWADITGGTVVPIVNPGFEADFVDPGCFTVVQPAGWTVYDPGGIQGGNDVVGVLDPTGSKFFPGGAPEGIRVALTFLAEQVGQSPMGLTQVLTETLQPNTTYVLTVQVGDIESGTGARPCDVFGFFDLDGFPGYQVQLLAGGVVIAQDDNTLAATLQDGQFALSTVQAVIGGAHPQLGQPLEIRLINLNIPGTAEAPGIEVDFDDVMLTATPASNGIPAASEVWLGGMASALLVLAVGLIRRRNAAPAAVSGECPGSHPA